MLVWWDAGYRMSVLELHPYDEHLYIMSGTFVDERRACGPGTCILRRAGSSTIARRLTGARSLKSCPDNRRGDMFCEFKRLIAEKGGR